MALIIINFYETLPCSPEEPDTYPQSTKLKTKHSDCGHTTISLMNLQAQFALKSAKKTQTGAVLKRGQHLIAS